MGEENKQIKVRLNRKNLNRGLVKLKFMVLDLYGDTPVKDHGRCTECPMAGFCIFYPYKEKYSYIGGLFRGRAPTFLLYMSIYNKNCLLIYI
jgi:hypothetical protein